MPKVFPKRFDHLPVPEDSGRGEERRPWRHTVRPKSGPQKSFRSGFDILRDLDLFSPVSDGELSRFAALGRERRVERGDPVFPLLHAALPLALILEGEARLAWGRMPGEPLIRALEPGNLVGEIGMFDEFPDDGVARALTVVRLMEWDRDGVLEALRRWPDVALGLLGGMARSQRELHRRVAGICRQRAPRRLARALTGLVEDRGTRQRNGAGEAVLRVRRMPSRARLAEMAGMARETASRLLLEWEHVGWVGREGGDLLVLDEKALRREAGEAS
jgi:CRP/FNR family transcriptional regulator